MKQNKIKIFILVLTLAILSYCGFKYYAQKVKHKDCLVTLISSKVFDLNTFDIEVQPTLDINDFKIVNKKNGKILFENEKSKKGIVNDYGKRHFELYYKNMKVCEISHFSENSWQTYDYHLLLSMEENKIFVRSKHKNLNLFFKNKQIN